MRPPAFRGLSTEQPKGRGYSGQMRDVCVDGVFSHHECFNRTTGAWQRVYKAEDMLMYDADGNPPPTRGLQ